MSSLCASLLHSLIMWLTVSVLSPHTVHLLFCCKSIFAIIIIIIDIIILFLVSFFYTDGHPLRDSKSLQVSRTLLSILADHNNTVNCRVSAHPPISIFSSPLSKQRLEKLLSAPITIGIIVTFKFHSIFYSVGLGCRIHQLLLWRRVRPSHWVSWIWHWAIWCCGSSNTEALENTEYPFIAIAPRSTLARSGSTW